MFVPLFPQNFAVINIQRLTREWSSGCGKKWLYIGLRFKCLYCSEIRVGFNENPPSTGSVIKGNMDKTKFTQRPKCWPQYQTLSKFVKQLRKLMRGWTQIYHRAYTFSNLSINTTNLSFQPVREGMVLVAGRNNIRVLRSERGKHGASCRLA
jgi:hypothetical protein